MATICVAGGDSVHAQSGGLDLLRLPIGAAPVALGEAYTAARGSLEAGLYNPASLAGMNELSLAVSLMNAPDLFDLRFVSAGAAVGEVGVVAAFVRSLVFDRIPLLSESGASLGSFSPSAVTAGLTVARAVGPAIDVGVSLKWMSVELVPGDLGGLDGASGRASGWAADVGLAYQPPGWRPLSLGLALLDMGPSLQLGRDGDALPTRLRVGVALDIASALGWSDRFPWSALLLVDRVQSLQAGGGSFRYGLELRPHSLLALRGGLGPAPDGLGGTRASVGLGVVHPRLRIEFAYDLAGSPALSDQTHVSLGVNF